jgi:hypothetical protein
MIEDVMKTAGVSGAVDSVTESGTTDLAAGKGELHLTLSASGSWNAIMKFEGLLEKIPYKATINSVTLSRATGETAGWRASVMITALADKASAVETDNEKNDEEI